MEKGRQMRLTEGELRTIKETFEGNDDLLKIMRKIFLPEYDANSPVGQIVDLWQTIPIEGMDDDQLVKTFRARNDLIKHVEARLQELKTLAGMKDETESEKKVRLSKDSTK